jgi:energy-coupling factor transport system ATP-binding protein
VLIRAERLGYTYAIGTPLERVAVRDVDLRIDPGERVGLLGPTGSGKSTLVQLVAGLLRPTSGQVLLDGLPARGRGSQAASLRGRIGLAFQYPESQIFEQTVFREVAFGPRNLGLSGEEVTARVRWALDMVGLDYAQIGDRVPFTLSGGEMRRLALASILAMRPEVLILDEPTSGLDPQGRHELLSRILAWQRRMGFTLIFVSHDQDALARIVERAVVLVDGSIAADGPVREVLCDREHLQRVGLDVPQTVLLLQALQRASWPVRTDCLLIKEAVDDIVKAWSQREGLA